MLLLQKICRARPFISALAVLCGQIHEPAVGHAVEPDFASMNGGIGDSLEAFAPLAEIQSGDIAHAEIPAGSRHDIPTGYLYKRVIADAKSDQPLPILQGRLH